MKESFFAGVVVMDKSLDTAPQISNAHGAGILVGVDLAESLNLHGAGKRNQSVSQKIQLCREKSDQKKQ